MTGGEYTDAVAYTREVAPWVAIPPAEELERGGIVGIVSAAECRPWPSPRSYDLKATLSRWHNENCFGLYLEHHARLPFHPCKGQLGFFEPPTPVCADCGDSGIAKRVSFASRPQYVAEPCPCAIGRWLRVYRGGDHA